MEQKKETQQVGTAIYDDVDNIANDDFDNMIFTHSQTIKEFTYLYHKEGRDESECLDKNCNIIPGKSIIIKDDKRGKFMVFESYEDYYEYYKGKQFLTHEVIMSWMKQKPKFDLDGGNKEIYDDFIEIVEAAFLETYDVEPRFVVCDSSGKGIDDQGKEYYKFSRHVIVSNYAFSNSREANWFTNEIIKPMCSSKIAEYVDWNVNKLTQNFRTPGSIKEGRQKKVHKLSKPQDAMITLCDGLPVLPPKAPIDKNQSFDISISDQAKTIINEKVDKDIFDLDTKYSKGNKFVFSRLKASYCELCNRIHDSVGMYICVFPDSIRQFCYRNETKKSIVLWAKPEGGFVEGGDLIKADEVMKDVTKEQPITYGINNNELKTQYSDYLKLMTGEVHQGRGRIQQFVRDTIAYTINNGKSHYIMKGFCNGEIEYTSNKTIDKDISFAIMENGKMMTVKLADIVKDMRNEITYSREDFMPFLIEEPIVYEKVFNTFSGFRHRYDPNFVVDMSKFNLILSHIKEVMCGGKDELYNFFIGWLASIIQKPADKLGVAILLKSESQGVGKNALCEFIAQHIIGSKHSVSLTGMDKLICRFNAHLGSKLFTICDEIKNYDNGKDVIDVLKSVITQKMVEIESKGIDSVKMSDFNNYIFLTNNSSTLKIDPTDRRFFVLDCINNWANDKDYFTKFFTQVNDLSGIHMFHWLARYDLSKFSRYNIPNTELKINMKLDSVNPPVRMLIEIATEQINDDILKPFDNKVRVSSDNLYNMYRTWSEQSGFRGQYTKVSFGREINKIIKSKDIRFSDKKCKGYEFTLQELKDLLMSQLRVDRLE